MLVNIGDLPTGTTVPFFFPAYDANGASVTITGLAVTDIEIYKGTSMTQRASDNGYALIDTDGIDLDSITGIHGFSIDMSDNSDSGFYAAGSYYHIVVDAITVASQTVRFIFRFSLGLDLRPTTAGRTLDVSSGGEAGLDWANIGSPTTSQTLSGTTVGTASAVTTVNGLAANVITATSIQADAITAAKIADNAIDAGAIASDAITAAKIATGAITSAKFAAGAIDAAAIATDAIDADALKTDAVTEIQTGLATSTALASLVTTVGVAGAGLTEAGGTGDQFTQIPWNASWDAEVQSEVSDELTSRGYTAPRAGYLDNINNAALATTAAQTGDAFARLGAPAGASVSADVAAVKTETASLLTNLATLAGKFTGITLLAQWLGAMAGKHTANATALTEINATGAGSGTFATGDGLEGIRDNLSAGGGDATAANQTTIIAHLVGIKGASWAAGDNLKAIEDGIAALSVAAGAGAFSVPLTIYQTGGVTLVPECDVILTTTSSSPSTNIYASGRTNANGIVTFQCDAGTYYIWRQKAGLNFSDNPKTLTVDGSGTPTVS